MEEESKSPHLSFFLCVRDFRWEEEVKLRVFPTENEFEEICEDHLGRLFCLSTLAE